MKLFNSLEGAALIPTVLGLGLLIWAFIIWNDNFYCHNRACEDETIRIRTKGQVARSLGIFLLGIVFISMGVRIFLIA